MELVMIFAIIFGAVFGTRFVKLLLSHRKEIKQLELEQQSGVDRAQNVKLQQQVEQLTGRVEVLEKIVTDQKYQLEKEIASL